jgi:hypothetical protein
MAAVGVGGSEGAGVGAGSVTSGWLQASVANARAVSAVRTLSPLLHMFASCFYRAIVLSLR